MMRYDTPLRKQHEQWVRHAGARAPQPGTEQARAGAAQGHREGLEVEYMSYGPADADGGCEIVSTFGEVESEYAALRRGAGLIDHPDRATLIIRGKDRHDFLNSMLTTDVRPLSAAGGARASFWLDRKGRITADLLLVETGDQLFVDVDVHQAESVVTSLDGFIFAEDVEIVDATADWHRIALHGPSAGAVLNAAAGASDLELDAGAVGLATIAGVSVHIARRDLIGDAGMVLFVPRDQAAAVWSALLATEIERVRPVGWHAFNIARIEAGTPMFNVDFGTTNLPHETGVFEDRVSTTKGCFLGQEIVARMHNLGRPKQQLIGLAIDGEALPVAGTPVLPTGASVMDEPIGVVTSSAPSPMLGARSVAFAMVRTAALDDTTGVSVVAEGETVAATVCELTFWTREAATS